MKTLHIVYEELFKYTDNTPVDVILTDEQFEELCKRFGIYSFDWYFVESDFIKYYKDGKWDYITYNPHSVINYNKIHPA